MKTEENKLRQPTLLLITLVAFCSIYSNWLPIRTVPASDFYQFWVVANEMTEGRAGDIYSEAERTRIGARYLNEAKESGERLRLRTASQRAVLETYSTPFLYTVFSVFTSGDYENDLASFRAFSLMTLIIAVAVLCRLLGYGRVATIAAIAVFASWFAPTRSDWLVANVNSLQLACLAFFVFLSSRFPTSLGHAVGGLILGLSAMFKPNVIILILLLMISWLVRRRQEKVMFVSLGMIVSAIAAFGWSSMAFGDASIWGSWFSVLSTLPDQIITFELGNHAPARLLSDRLGVDMSTSTTVVCLGLALAAIMRGLWGRPIAETRAQPGIEDLHVVAVASAVTLLSSPLSWLHYFVAAIPILLIVLRPSSPNGGIGPLVFRALAWVALLAVMMRPMVILDVGDEPSRAIFLALGMTVLFLMGLRVLLSFKTEEP